MQAPWPHGTRQPHTGLSWEWVKGAHASDRMASASCMVARLCMDGNLDGKPTLLCISLQAVTFKALHLDFEKAHHGLIRIVHGRCVGSGLLAVACMHIC